MFKMTLMLNEAHSYACSFFFSFRNYRFNILNYRPYYEFFVDIVCVTCIIIYMLFEQYYCCRILMLRRIIFILTLNQRHVLFVVFYFLMGSLPVTFYSPIIRFVSEKAENIFNFSIAIKFSQVLLNKFYFQLTSI